MASNEGSQRAISEADVCPLVSIESNVCAVQSEQRFSVAPGETTTVRVKPSLVREPLGERTSRASTQTPLSERFTLAFCNSGTGEREEVRPA